LSQQNISFLEELDIESSKLVPIISYPRFSADEYSERISEMRSLGITSISLGGRTIVNGLAVAGKGCVGLVVRARIGDNICALKIRRVDADRKSMDAEVHLHQIANSAGAGPQLKGHTKNLVVMEFAEGKSIVEWADGATKGRARSVIRAVLEQCRNLDRARLDHGELSRLDRHIIVSHTPVIIDFESASTVRKTCNVTAAAQSIFLYGPVATRIQKILGTPDKEKVISALKTYKQDQSDANFGTVLDSLSI
jgi:putative serine/threonine protein kinase